MLPRTTATEITALQDALALYNKGQLTQAQALCERVLQTQPRQVDALHLAGVIAALTGHYQRAAELIGQAIDLLSGNAMLWSSRGNALQKLGQFEAAVADYDKAIALQPDYADAYTNRGNALEGLRQFEAALASHAKAIALKPDYAEAHSNHGNALQKLNRLEAAVASYDRAIALRPNYAKAYSNRGNALKRLHRLEAALASFDQAIAMKPDYAEAYSNRGSVLKELREPEAALASYDRAIALKPDFAEAYANRGNVFQEIHQLKDAITDYDRAIAIHPGYANAYWNKCMALLLAGDYGQGWPLYEWRWKNDKIEGIAHRQFTQPLWLGREPLNGKTILLHGEQGLGDTIQFCRYARQVADLGATVILEVPQPLVRLLRGLDGVAHWVAAGDDLPPFDYQCPLLSLPLAFKTTLSTVPASPAYLRSDPALMQAWAARLGPKTGQRVGIVWSGGTGHKNDRHRSQRLSDWLAHLPQGLEYVSLQKEVREADRETLQAHPEIRHFGNELNDFADTAALCELMDLVISVDTSVAHLSGALGRPTWILVPYSPDFRWLLDRDDSPWYPSVKLYRQPTHGDWDSVLARVAGDLAESSVPPKTIDAPIRTQLTTALALYDSGKLAEADALCAQVLQFEPANVDALHLMGVIAARTQHPQRGINLIGKAIEILPGNAMLWTNRGSAHEKLQQFEAAVADYDKAISLQPMDAGLYLSRGNALVKLKQLEAAVTSFDRAIALRPDYAEAHFNRGVALKELNRLQAAVASYDQAISLKPDYAKAYWNKCMALLLGGDFEQGWALYEWRWNEKLKARHTDRPLWLGKESIKGKTILLHAEQGLGDTIQFCRYARQVADLGAQVILEVPQPLLGLLHGLDGVVQLIATGAALPPFDYQCPLLSLPLAFKTTLSTVPASQAYLRSDPALVADWAAKLGPATGQRVGIVWSGNIAHKNDGDRSQPLSDWLAHLPQGLEYVSLQKEVREADRETLQAHSHIRHFGDELGDFADTAALCELMDLVISVDTSVAHLSGALGRPTWILVPYSPDFRWLLDRDDSPWYPSVKLYRQPTHGDWDRVLARLAGDLAGAPATMAPQKTIEVQRAKTLFAKALALYNDGQLAEAQALCAQVLRAHPKHVDSLHLAGVIAAQTHHPQRGVELIGQAIDLLPGNAMLWTNRGNAHEKLKQFESALADYDKAIALQPTAAGVYLSRGNALQALNRPEAALASFEQAIALQPDFAEAHFNSGNALRDLNRLDAAIASYGQAVRLRPDYVKALINRGNVLQELGQIDAAMADYDRAVAIAPHDVDGQWNKCLALLVTGNYGQGWPLYEWRWKNKKLDGLRQRHLTHPQWLGQEPLKGKAILLHSEQGFGDTIQFCRYARQVADLGATVIMEVPRPLLRLLSGLDGAAVQWVAAGADLPPFDYQCPLLSLPLAFKTTLATIPSSQTYLRSDTALMAHWSTRLGPKTGQRVGIVWSGNTAHKKDSSRSLRLSDWLARLPRGLEYVSLQKEVREADRETLQAHPHIRHFGDELGDFADTAALCELMDLVISVDTSVAHLSGALGKPTWILLAHSPDFRWLLERQDSPWYPSVRLYRQPARGDWDSVLERVAGDLTDSGKPKRRTSSKATATASFELVKARTDRAVALKRDDAKAHCNRGNALRGLLQWDAALASYDSAIAIDPGYAEAHFNRGKVLTELRQPQAAVASYDKAIALHPDYANGHWNKSLALLLAGDFEHGWKLYEWRWKNAQAEGVEQRRFEKPLWLGKRSLKRKTILLHAEQGLGDTIQFCRYARQVADLGAQVILEVPQPLIRLLRSLEGVAQWFATGAPLPPFDYQCPLLSLPLAFKTTRASIPAGPAYLRSDPALVAHWSAKLGRKTKRRVGIAWSGASGHKNDRDRSQRLSDWLAHLPQGLEYVSLQKEVREADRATLQARQDIRHFGDELSDFADTAALCELMDIVISVDTSVAHLSGALGRPTWILLPYSPDFRWLLDRGDSPWYPSVKLYRQESRGDWDGVLARVTQDLGCR